MDRSPVTIDAAGTPLVADLALLPGATGLVILAHGGDDGGRSSPAAVRLAGALEDAGLATLLVDLLAPEEALVEEAGRRLRFDLELLTSRLVGIVDWAGMAPVTKELHVGLFGAGTGAAAALAAAARRPQVVQAVVSCGGRPELAASALPVATAPVLLVVGSRDRDLLHVNARAAYTLPAAGIAVVPGTTHLSEEPGALDEVARLTRDWFVRYLTAAPEPVFVSGDGGVRLPFTNRHEAAVLLAKRLSHYAGQADVLVLGLPRGGVPIADVVARALAAPLDVVVVRKLGAPGHEELAMGAIAPQGVQVLNPEIAGEFSAEEVDAEVAREREELRRREQLFRGDRPALDVAGKVVLLVDDGLATGATMRAALAWARQQHARRVIVAVPVAAADAVTLLEAEADEVVCLVTPEPFFAVGCWYMDFRPVSEAEVTALLSSASTRAAPEPPRGQAGDSNAST